MRNRSTINIEAIDKQLAALPPQLFNAYESDATGKKIYEIGKTHGLAINKIGEIADEIGYLILGLIPVSEFLPDLADIVGEKERAKKIAVELNQQVLLPIRESLKRAYGDSWTDTVVTGVERTTPPLRPKPAAPPPTQFSRKESWTGKPPPIPPRPAPPPSPAGLKKPEPLIIRPLPPMARISEEPMATREGLAPMPELKAVPSPKPPTAPAVLPKPTLPPLPSAAKPPTPLATQPAIVIPSVPQKPQPFVITPTRLSPPKPAEKKPPVIQPMGQWPEETTRGRIFGSETVKLAEKPTMPAFQTTKQQPPAGFGPLAPNPMPQPAPAQSVKSQYIITKEMMEREIERMRQRQASEMQGAGGKVQGADELKPAAPQPRLPPQRIPKPPAPERYVIDPYREPQE